LVYDRKVSWLQFCELEGMCCGLWVTKLEIGKPLTVCECLLLAYSIAKVRQDTTMSPVVFCGVMSWLSSIVWFEEVLMPWVATWQ
jgi:hypothetical protein